MYNKYEIKYSSIAIKRFYKSLRFTRFLRLVEERRELLDALVEKNRFYFKMDTTTFASFVTSTAIKLYQESQIYGFLNDDEKVYFYVKMVDPDFKYLEIYEAFYNVATQRDAAHLNFGYYDNVIIYFERLLNKRFRMFQEDELWMRESIKRVRLNPNTQKRD